MAKKKVNRKTAHKETIINLQEQRPQIDPETSVRPMENFCSCLRSIHLRLGGVCNNIDALANEITRVDGALFVYKNLLNDELVNLEETISEFEGTYEHEEKKD